jgi:hypothetical protein
MESVRALPQNIENQINFAAGWIFWIHEKEKAPTTVSWRRVKLEVAG